MASSNILGFGGGFAKGFASALAEGRRVSREEAHREEARKEREFTTIFPLVWGEAEQTGDFSRANELVGQYMPDLAKNLKKQGAGITDLADVLKRQAPPLAQPTPGAMRTTQQGFEQGSTAQMEAGGAPLLESRPAVSPGTPPAPAPQPPESSIFLGMPMTTPTQKIESRTAAARRFARANPDVGLMAAFKMFGLDVPTLRGATAQSVLGKDAQGNQVMGVFEPDRAAYVYPEGHPQAGQPIPGFVKTTSASESSLGAMAERAARSLGFDSARAAYAAGQAEAVNAKVDELTKGTAFARGMGTGRAAIQTELDKPIGATAASLFPGMSPTTTLRELQKTVPVTAQQQEKIRSLGQVEELLNEIGGDPSDPTDLGLIGDVFPEVEPGVWGRIQTQFALGAKRLAADEKLATLDAAINGALAQVAQLSGQPGSRLSDKDIELARGQLASLTPKLFGGDTLATAQARIGVLRRLLMKAKSGLPTTATPAGAPGAAAIAPGAVPPTPAGAAAGAPAGVPTASKDANGNWVINLP